MKTLAIVQARMESVRLPGKVMMEINEVPLINILLQRLSQAKLVDKIVVAIPDSKENDVLSNYLKSLRHIVERGSKNNVLERYYKVSKKYKSDLIVRITGDCPLVDPNIVDQCIEKLKSSDSDYQTNTLPPTYPDGLDVEVFSYNSLETCYQKAHKIDDLEHVTKFIRDSKEFKKENFTNSEDLSNLRWTVDEKEDFDFVKKIFSYFKPNILFTWEEVLKLIKENPKDFPQNQQSFRNEGSNLSKGQKIWRRANKVIHSGNMLLSKNPDMFLPNKWPAYFHKSKGCNVWDLEGNKYIDMSVMGVGTNILGYGNEEVDEAVRETINLGNMSTLNCEEEVYLAEKIVSMHPWSNKLKFARSGGEANAIAVRIARSFAKNKNIAVCGYHGWHDWYLSANISDSSNLDNHLLPGLSTIGVPHQLKDSVFPFNYNDFDYLEKIIVEKNIGIVKMEVMRNAMPENNFLKKIREISNQYEIVLIFDECTSGFRETFGGLHKKFEIEPDIATFGKALGNGYAITAVLSNEKIMNAAEDSFMSSTFWTERIGPTAALKTLEIMERLSSWNIITDLGNYLKSKIIKIAKKNDLDVNTFGLPALTGFSFNSKDNVKYKTFISQEMLKNGFLGANCTYLCIDHSKEIIDEYIEVLDTIFSKISDCERGAEIDKLLHAPPSKVGFGRLN